MPFDEYVGCGTVVFISSSAPPLPGVDHWCVLRLVLAAHFFAHIRSKYAHVIVSIFAFYYQLLYTYICRDHYLLLFHYRASVCWNLETHYQIIKRVNSVFVRSLSGLCRPAHTQRQCSLCAGLLLAASFEWKRIKSDILKSDDRVARAYIYFKHVEFDYRVISYLIIINSILVRAVDPMQKMYLRTWITENTRRHRPQLWAGVIYELFCELLPQISSETFAAPAEHRCLVAPQTTRDVVSCVCCVLRLSGVGRNNKKK